MMNSLKKQIMSMRIRAQAYVLLTSRDDLEIQEDRTIEGIDLLVSIIKNNRATGRQFGVILHAHIREYTSLKQAGTVLSRTIAKREEFDPGPWPICVFSFVMTGREGYYAWLVEPSIGEHGPRVRYRKNLECRELDQESLAEIIRQTNEYYDTLTGVLGGS